MARNFRGACIREMRDENSVMSITETLFILSHDMLFSIKEGSA